MGWLHICLKMVAEIFASAMQEAGISFIQKTHREVPNGTTNDGCRQVHVSVIGKGCNERP